jgi:hypothetical protein
MMKLKIFLLQLAALCAAFFAVSASAVLPTAPGNPAYSVNFDVGGNGKGTAIFWREKLSDGNEYLLVRLTPAGSQLGLCTLSNLNIVVDAGILDSVSLFTDLPVVNANKPDVCNIRYAEPKTWIVAPFDPILNKVGWTAQKQQTIRFVTSSSIVSSIVLPVSGTPAGSLATAFNFSDAWYVPSESGWGILISHHVDTGGNMFVTFYVYDDQGRAKWYSLSGGTWAGAEFTGDVFEITGPPGGFATLGGFDPSRVKVNKAGTATFNFTSRDTAQFSYNVSGASGNKSIRRLAF